MRESELEKILRDLRLDSKMRKIHNNGDTNIMFNCPYHGERNPSCGISVQKEVGACFSCGKSFHIPDLVMHVLGISFNKAMDWLEERVKINKQAVNELRLRRFDEIVEKESYEILPRFKLAPYQSGKVYHSYLEKRGFSRETSKEFLLGWDSELSRITVPIFDIKNNLQGFIGRTVFNESDPEYFPLYGTSQRYRLYPPLKKSFSLFPIHKVELDDELILVEGTLDSIWMWQCGFRNVLSTITSHIAHEQIKIINNLGVRSIILALDNDKAGKDGMEKAIKELSGTCKLYTVEYTKKDPCDHTKEELMEIFRNKKLVCKKSLKRIE